MTKISDKIIFLADRLSAKRPSQEERFFDDELFLLDEGLELLASYRAIADGATRQRLRDSIDAAARGEVRSAPAEVVHLVTLEKSGRPAPVRKKWKTAAGFVALLIGASIFLEIIDPAPTDVAADSIRCAPADVRQH